MRELKFRAWSVAEKIMVDSDASIATILAKHIKAGRGLQNGNGPESAPGDYEIMQFTGMKDEGGDPVYEGDIISIWYPDGSGKTRNEAVIYRENSAGFDTRFVEDFLRAKFRVIGNIRETPELLKVTP